MMQIPGRFAGSVHAANLHIIDSGSLGARPIEGGTTQTRGTKPNIPLKIFANEDLRVSKR